MDLSALRKWEILGPDAEALVQYAVTRDITRLSDGQVVYTAMCNETGGMIDDATVFRLGADNYRFVGGDPTTACTSSSSPTGSGWSASGSRRPPTSCTTSPCRGRRAARS